MSMAPKPPLQSSPFGLFDVTGIDGLGSDVPQSSDDCEQRTADCHSNTGGEKRQARYLVVAQAGERHCSNRECPDGSEGGDHPFGRVSIAVDADFPARPGFCIFTFVVHDSSFSS